MPTSLFLHPCISHESFHSNQHSFANVKAAWTSINVFLHSLTASLAQEIHCSKMWCSLILLLGFFWAGVWVFLSPTLPGLSDGHAGIVGFYSSQVCSFNYITALQISSCWLLLHMRNHLHISLSYSSVCWWIWLSCTTEKSHLWFLWQKKKKKS